MKTIAFFSEKGGVGKSSFSILYASWLKYQYGINVGVADFNFRINQYRKSEIRERQKLMKENPSLKQFDLDKAWPIATLDLNYVNEMRESADPTPNYSWFENEIKRGKLKNMDVIVCDFPGAMTGGEFSDLIQHKKIGVIIIPTEKDEMTLTSTMKLKSFIEKISMRLNFEQPYAAFINRSQVNLKNFRNSYLKLAARMVKSGIPLLPDMISSSERMLTIDKVDILRSTFGFPDFKNPENDNNNDLGLENLFIDVTRELKKVKDIPGTAPADLSFVDSLKKKSDGRQFRGSAFPEYEI